PPDSPSRPPTSYTSFGPCRSGFGSTVRYVIETPHPGGNVSTDVAGLTKWNDSANSRRRAVIAAGSWARRSSETVPLWCELELVMVPDDCCARAIACDCEALAA